MLDIGCGTGVLAHQLAERGFDVVGVDPAAASLAVARAKPGADGVRWVEAGATALPVTEDVDVAVMTGNVAQVFLDDEEWGAALRRAAARLGAGGHLVLETRDPERRAWEEWTPEATYLRTEDPVEGVVESWQQVVAVDLPLVSFETRFRFADGSVTTSPSTLRFRSREEVEQSLADAWLDLVEVRDAPDRPGRELVFVARKPEDPRDAQDRGWRDLARIDADLETGLDRRGGLARAGAGDAGCLRTWLRARRTGSPARAATRPAGSTRAGWSATRSSATGPSSTWAARTVC